VNRTQLVLPCCGSPVPFESKVSRPQSNSSPKSSSHFCQVNVPRIKAPRLLVVSHVWPFPGSAGQQLRVRYTLEAAVRQFQVDFLTFAPLEDQKITAAQIEALGCRPIVLESAESARGVKRLAQSSGSALFMLRTGLKKSNYLIGRVELSPSRIESAVNPRDYDAVLYEYFHAVDSVHLFRAAGVPAILDMHNVLWKSLEQRLNESSRRPAWFKNSHLARYRRREESAWDHYDALIAINRQEYELVQARQRPTQKLFYAPMGTDLSLWPFSWRPAVPLRVAYYGGLGSSHNEAAALRCRHQIMPLIWRRFPEAELWLVGSNPSERLHRLTQDPRVKVTGFVEKIQDIISTMSLVLCPWSGTYGFRSRIVEVMALGVPVVATPAAVDGMQLESGRGLILAESDELMAAGAVELLSAPERLAGQSRLARFEMERLYSLENTYGRLMREVHEWLEARRERRAELVVDPGWQVASGR
jgi:glycosyltransferase involved in cell wall biosynthesis